MIRKTALSFLIGLIVPVTSLLAQQQIPLKPKPIAPFSGSLYIQGFMQEDPKKEYKNNGELEIRITIDGDKIAFDSMSEKGRHQKDARLIFDAGAKKLIVCETRYEEMKTAHIVDLSDKKIKYSAKQDSHSMQFRMVNSPEFKFKYTVTDQVQQISEFSCRKILAENAMVSLELWVTDQLGLKIADFDKVFKVTKDLDGTFEFFSMIGSLPDALKNTFPVRIIAREKQFKKSYYDIDGSEGQTKKPIYRPSVVMLNIVKVDHIVDPKVFDLQGYAMVKENRFGRHNDEEDADMNNVPTDSTAPAQVTPAPADNNGTPAPSNLKDTNNNTVPADKQKNTEATK